MATTDRQRRSKRPARRSAGGPAGSGRTAAPRTNRELRDQSLARIYDAALSRFVKDGYLSTTVEQIAADAGLTKGGVYFYIGKKELLLLQIIERIKREYVDDFFEKIRDQRWERVQDKLVALIHWQVNYARDNPREIMLMVMISSSTSAELSDATAKLLEIYDLLHGFVEQIVEEGTKNGEFRTHLSKREIASFFIAAHDGMMLEWYRRRRNIDGRELVRVLRELMLTAVNPGKPRTRK